VELEELEEEENSSEGDASSLSSWRGSRSDTDSEEIDLSL